MPTYAVVADGVVTDVVLWDGENGWRPDRGEAVLVPEGERYGIGWSYDGGTWTAPPPAPAPPETWDTIRMERDARLAASDWTQVADAPVDAAAWAAYRQALRDVPQDYATPDEVVWPIPPA